MQTPFSQHPYSPELFTRERRRTRLQHFLASLERPAVNFGLEAPELAPIKLDGTPAKTHAWTAPVPR